MLDCYYRSFIVLAHSRVVACLCTATEMTHHCCERVLYPVCMCVCVCAMRYKEG